MRRSPEGRNLLHIIHDHALSAAVDYDLKMEDPYMKGKCCGIISFIAKGGTVGRIDGLEEAVKRTPSVRQYENRYPIGFVTPDGDTLRQLMVRFVMICDSRKQMAEDIKYLNRHISVQNDKGEDMVIKMNTELMFGGYKTANVTCLITERSSLNFYFAIDYLCPERGAA